MSAFTLIELLVVVAIIALLISILLPSLGNARAQARAAQCASRISQIAKSMLLYSDDFSETPPFIGRGWEDCWDSGRLNSEVVPATNGLTLMQWASMEDWLMPNPPSYWLSEQVNWPASAQVRNGSLFKYARFEGLYRCPEFERVTDSMKSQSVFNYTRTLIGRKWFHKKEADRMGNYSSEWVTSQASDNWAGIGGPIVKTSQVYAPSQLHMIFDERWDRYCAALPEIGRKAGEGQLLNDRITEVWMEVEGVFSATADEIGQYHGTRVPSQLAPPEIRNQVPSVKRGNAAFYDGHVSLELDPLPDRKLDLDSASLAVPFFEWLMGHLFAQRGIPPSMDLFDNPLG
jgi:prepilin-type N-terminal cleavage/methylation domain-containing protein/prepilin-type processing-associated H-X9-DG protein